MYERKVEKRMNKTASAKGKEIQAEDCQINSINKVINDRGKAESH